MASWYQRKDDVVTLNLHVQPGAKSSSIAGLHGDALKIRLAAPPIEGRANQALMKFLAEIFAVPLRNIKLLRGQQSRHKIVQIAHSAIDPASVFKGDIATS